MSERTVSKDELEPPGGAVPLNSRFYILRQTDKELHAAIARQDSIVLITGPRQVGKTSLLARGLQQIRDRGSAVLLTDLQQLTASTFDNVGRLLRALGELVADNMDLSTRPGEDWNDCLCPTSNFERYIRREVLAKTAMPVIWAFDEVDRLFSFDYATDIFGLFRSWHNMRALDPEGPWDRLTLVLAYATEAHLFITDLNQSPFNVGTRLALEDFSVTQVAELNKRYDNALRNEDEIRTFHCFLGGHPFLSQRGLYEIARGKTDLVTMQAQADEGEGIFRDHLRRILKSLERDPALLQSLKAVIEGQDGLSSACFYRLRSAGVLGGDSPQAARPRCDLYARYLKRHLL
jgi:hypothetical protein